MLFMAIVLAVCADIDFAHSGVFFYVVLLVSLLLMCFKSETLYAALVFVEVCNFSHKQVESEMRCQCCVSTEFSCLGADLTSYIIPCVFMALNLAGCQSFFRACVSHSRYVDHCLAFSPLLT